MKNHIQKLMKVKKCVHSIQRNKWLLCLQYFLLRTTLNPHVYLSNAKLWRRNFMVMIIFIIIELKWCVFIWACWLRMSYTCLVFQNLNFAFIRKLNHLVSPWNFYSSTINQYFFQYHRGVDGAFSLRNLECKNASNILRAMQASNLVWKGYTTIHHNHNPLILFAQSMSFEIKIAYNVLSQYWCIY